MNNEYIFLTQSCILMGLTLLMAYIGLEALVTAVSVFCIFANIFVIKQIGLFGFNATGADVFTIGATIALNMIQEYYGKQAAKKAIIINFVTLAAYGIVSQINIWYNPSLCDTTHAHFCVIFQSTPRIIIASFIVYFMTQILDYFVYGFLKRVWHKRFLVVRNYLSMSFSQLFDTIAFSFFGLYGIVDTIGEIIIISYSVKILAIVMSTPIILLGRLILAEK